MNRIAAVFGTSPVLLPVIHPISREEALAAVHIAQGLGIRGVFLIDQGMIERDVLALVREVREQYPSLWIGVNLLSREPAEALVVALGAGVTVDGLWSDNAGIDERHVRARAESFITVRQRVNWTGLYFGGVAFKYQREIAQEHLGQVAKSAAPYMDVICTSGPGTGYPADVGKVQALRSGLGDHDHALALASGITPENVRGYMPYVQAFLVGTGIESRLGVLDPAKVEALLAAMQKKAD